MITAILTGGAPVFGVSRQAGRFLPAVDCLFQGGGSWLPSMTAVLARATWHAWLQHATASGAVYCTASVLITVENSYVLATSLLYRGCHSFAGCPERHGSTDAYSQTH